MIKTVLNFGHFYLGNCFKIRISIFGFEIVGNSFFASPIINIENNMSDTYIIKQRGNGFVPHILENIQTGKKIELCSCGGTHNTDGICDGTYKQKKTLGCGCEYCMEKLPKVNQNLA